MFWSAEHLPFPPVWHSLPAAAQPPELARLVAYNLARNRSPFAKRRDEVVLIIPVDLERPGRDHPPTTRRSSYVCSK